MGTHSPVGETMEPGGSCGGLGAPRSIQTGFQKAVTGSETGGGCGGVDHTKTKERGKLMFLSIGGTLRFALSKGRDGCQVGDDLDRKTPKGGGSAERLGLGKVLGGRLLQCLNSWVVASAPPEPAVHQCVHLLPR